ncbi:MAG: alpha/beta hydrolase [Acidobacteriota bacterium]
MGSRFGVMLKLFMFFCVMAGIALIVATWFFFKRPLTLDAWFSRFALGAAGLSRQETTGPDGNLTWFEGGEGERTLMLLHGAGDQAGTWARVVSPLLKRYRVIIPDLPGHGDSDPEDGPIGVDQVLAGVEAVLDATCQDQPVVLVGNSLGGWVSFLVALERPAQVERIVALNGGPIRQDNPAVNLFPANREEARKTMEGLMGSGSKAIPPMVLDDIVRRVPIGPAARVAATADSMGPFLLDDRLAEVTTPVDLIWGDADQLFPVAYAERLREGLPAARLRTLEDCGHIPHRECPIQVVEALFDVFEQGPPAPSSPVQPEAATEQGKTS